MSKNKKQTIKCDVESCKYNNTDDKLCDLDEIKVSCICDNDDCGSTDETICDSFEEKDFDDEEYQEELIEEEDDDDFDEDENEEFIIEEYVEIETEEE